GRTSRTLILPFSVQTKAVTGTQACAEAAKLVVDRVPAADEGSAPARRSRTRFRTASRPKGSYSARIRTVREKPVDRSHKQFPRGAAGRRKVEFLLRDQHPFE